MTRLFLKHPVVTWMIFSVFVVLGLYALPKLKIEAIPEVDLPSLTIVTSWNGASPQAIQRSITLPIEEAVRSVHGVESIRSVSRPGRSSVEVEFKRGTSLDFAQLDLNEQLGPLRRDLPLSAQQPVVYPYVPEEFQTEQFFTASIESPLSPNELRERAETWLPPRILAIEGVADARIQGGARPLIKIKLDRGKLELYSIDATEVLTAITELDAINVAGVVKDEGRETIVSVRKTIDIETLREAEIARRGNHVFRLGELAELSPDYEDPVYLVRINGKSVVQLNVDKRSGANTVTVSRALRKALPEIERSLPFDAELHVDEDQGEELEEKLRSLVYRSLIILALLFVLLALSLRQIKLTAIVTGSIFFAILITLSLFYFFKISVNLITISGLTVSFGLLLDNSILVLDAIHRRVEHLQKSAWGTLSQKAKIEVVTESIIAGTSEVAFPILATTLTTLVAFLSFIFLSGRLSLYYVPLAISVATALMASLFVAFGWVPVVLKQVWALPMVRRMSPGSREEVAAADMEVFVDELPDLEARPGFYERLVQIAQKLWWVILPPVAILILWGFLDIYPNKMLKGGFFRLSSRERLSLYVEMPEGTELKYSAEILRRFEERLLPVPEGARMRATTFGSQCFLSVEFEDSLLTTELPSFYREMLTNEADKTGGSSVYITGFSDTPYFKGAFGGSIMNSEIKISGYNYGTLSELAEGAKKKLLQNRRVRRARITSGRRFDRAVQEETVINVDRIALGEYGLTVLDLVQQLRLLLSVDTPLSMMLDGKQERMQLSYIGSEDFEYRDLVGALIPLPGGGKVRLGDLISIETLPTPGSVVRENQRYTVFLNWEYVGTDSMRKSTIQKSLNGLDLPYGYTAEEGNQDFFTQDEENELNLMAFLAAAFIFIVLAALFESLELPLIVMSSIFMAMIGVFLVFWFTRSEFDSSARIGLVLLFGIVVNNAILLVSRYRYEAAQILRVKLGGNPGEDAALFKGMSKQLGGSDLYSLPRAEAASLLRRAVARGTRIRLRSILLTSLTTVVGLVPLLIQIDNLEGLSILEKIASIFGSLFEKANPEQQDIWYNLALSSIGGLISSTILLLLAMPPLYYFCVRTGWVVRRVWSFFRRILSPAT
jgi:hydrophobic/amphiphilic exporter-1 (mainly G- bacteria), HAE1 family